MKRIFIAVRVVAGKTLSNTILSLKSALGSETIRWVHPDNIHITLAFLGDTEEDRIDSLCEMLAKQCGGSGDFEFIIKGLGVFKSLASPRVIWTGIESSERLMQLNRLIINGLKDIDFTIEDRPFRPHLTIGRLKYPKDIAALRTLVERYQNKEIQRVAIKKVILYESILLPAGPVYKPIIKVDL